MNSVRKALEKLYMDRCEIIERQQVTDPETNKTKFVSVTIHSDIPCRLSFSSIPATSDGNAAEMAQAVKLFLAPEVEVKPGSKITVTQENGTVTDYSNSGKPAVRKNHQEINLALFERWT